MDENDKKGRILIVDDTLKNIQVLGGILQKEGYQINVAQNGFQALDSVATMPPDLVLLDIMMPELDGFETCKLLKENAETTNIPVIFLTARGEVEDIVKGFELGAIDYITKPFNPKELRVRIHNHLQLKMAHNQLLKSEKMAALGYLVAGIAHEINTPFSVLQSGIGQLSTMSKHLQKFSDLSQSLSSDIKQLFFRLLKMIEDQGRIPYSTWEARQHRENLTKQLETMQVPHAEDLASNMVDMGVFTEIEQYLPLLRHDFSLDLIEIVNKSYQHQETLDDMQMAVDRVSKLIFALKNYSFKDFTGEQKSEIIIQEGIETVLALYHNQIKQGIELVIHYQNVPSITGYKDELIQVWMNLIQNAFQAMEHQGRLEVSLYTRQDNVVVDITDDGHGIPEDIRDKIFKPFFTTRPSGEGTGLGLDIVQRIVDKHHGRINVESKPGKTVFSVLLPITIR